MSTNVAKPAKVAIIGASGTYGGGILARAEEIGVEAVVVTRSPHKFKDVKPTTMVVEAQLDETEKSREVFAGARRERPRWCLSCLCHSTTTRRECKTLSVEGHAAREIDSKRKNDVFAAFACDSLVPRFYSNVFPSGTMRCA